MRTWHERTRYHPYQKLENQIAFIKPRLETSFSGRTSRLLQPRFSMKKTMLVTLFSAFWNQGFSYSETNVFKLGFLFWNRLWEVHFPLIWQEGYTVKKTKKFNGLQWEVFRGMCPFGQKLEQWRLKVFWT